MDPNRVHAFVRRAALAVSRELGPFMSEAVYQRALSLELQLASGQGAPQREVTREVMYKGYNVGSQRFDVLWFSCIIEIKTQKTRFCGSSAYSAQITRYLRHKHPHESVMLVVFHPKGVVCEIYSKNV